MAAAVLGLHWSELSFDSESGVAANFRQAVATPIEELAALNLTGRMRMVLRLLNVSKRTSKSVAEELDKKVFKGAGFCDLPDSKPQFIFKATSLHDGNLWIFTKERVGDYKTGYLSSHNVKLADAVVASAAFPPFLSPFKIRFNRADFKRGKLGPPGTQKKVDIHLTDGGVYDNLGLERAFKNHKRLFVSDASGELHRVAGSVRNWLGHMIRVTTVIDNQVRSLRRRQLMASFRRPAESGGREGTYWATTSDPGNYPRANTLIPVSESMRQYLSRIKTDLRSMDGLDLKRLVNWGYVIADVAVNSWVPEDYPGAKIEVPYPDVLLSE